MENLEQFGLANNSTQEQLRGVSVSQENLINDSKMPAKFSLTAVSSDNTESLGCM